MSAANTEAASAADVPRRISLNRTRADRVYRAVTAMSGLLTLVILFLIGLFLFIRALPAFHQNGLAFFTTSTWNPDGGQAGVAALVYGTVVIALIGLVIGIPISLLTALFLTEYVPTAPAPPADVGARSDGGGAQPHLRLLGVLLPAAAPAWSGRLAHAQFWLPAGVRDPGGAVLPGRCSSAVS